jgi:hypothetical protein
MVGVTNVASVRITEIITEEKPWLEYVLSRDSITEFAFIESLTT